MQGKSDGAKREPTPPQVLGAAVLLRAEGHLFACYERAALINQRGKLGPVCAAVRCS